jgi:hypothetical protein
LETDAAANLETTNPDPVATPVSEAATPAIDATEESAPSTPIAAAATDLTEAEPRAIESPAAPDMEVTEPISPAVSPPHQSMPQRLGDLLNQMFPAAAPVAPRSESMSSANDRALDPSTAPIFDIGLFLAADEAAQAAAIAPTNPVATSDDLWQELEPLIGPTPASQVIPAPPANSMVPTASPPEAPYAMPSGELAAENVSPPAPDVQAERSLPSPLADSPTQTALNFFRFAGSQPPVADPTVSGNPLFADSPSPILYPSRQPKKRKSLAAVELPQFPRKA